MGSHYLSLPSQGNVYLSAKFRKRDGTNKMFVACARRKVYLVEYQSLDDYLEPVTKEIYFAYTSSESLILVSLDIKFSWDIPSLTSLLCFRWNRNTCIRCFESISRPRWYSCWANYHKSTNHFSIPRQKNNYDLNLLFFQNADGNNNVLLNLYSDYDLETSTDVILETIGQSCESFALDYIPYGLYHVELPPHQINRGYEVHHRYNLLYNIDIWSFFYCYINSWMFRMFGLYQDTTKKFTLIEIIILRDAIVR